MKDIEYWNRYFNKIKDLIEQIPNYEKLNIFELYDEFTKRYDLKPTMDVFAVCRHYVNVRVYVRRIKAKVYDGKRERTIDEDGIYYLVRIDEKEREIIRKLLEERNLFSLYLAGVELPTDLLVHVYYLDGDIFRSVKEKKVLKELYKRKPEVLTHIYDNLIISWYDRANLSILPNPDIDDVEKVQILYVEDPILVKFVKSF